VGVQRVELVAVEVQLHRHRLERRDPLRRAKQLLDVRMLISVPAEPSTEAREHLLGAPLAERPG
jgi:hypothetical protein